MNRTMLFVMAAMVFVAFFTGCASIQNAEFKGTTAKETTYNKPPFM